MKTPTRLVRMRIKIICFFMTVVICLAFSANGTEKKLGLTVHEGELFLNGKPYRGIGVNYFDLFYRTLKQPSDMSYKKGLRELSKANIPFVRFMACGFYPIDWDLYLNNKKTYFTRLDRIVKAAEQANIGLIPSLFWHMPTVPDIVGEPMDQLGNPDSKTIAFIRQYTEEVVKRYRNSPAIWGWEFGNEYNLLIDLPIAEAEKNRPRVIPQLKTALKRSARDDLSSESMLLAYSEFAQTVREYDKNRVMITGNSIPRSSAYHNTKEKNWKKDSKDQFQEILLRDNPSPFDLISVHIYENDGQGGTESIKELVAMLQKSSKNAGKALFVGEFGAPIRLGTIKEKAVFFEILEAIVVNEAPLSAVWVFDYSNMDADWNITFKNNRSYMLKHIMEANQRMKVK